MFELTLYANRFNRASEHIHDSVVGIEKIEGDSSSEQRKFNVNIKFTKQIDMTRLREFFEGRTPEIPQDCITALEVCR